MSNTTPRFIIAADYYAARQYAALHNLPKIHYIDRQENIMGLQRGTMVTILRGADEHPRYSDIIYIARIRRFEVLHAEA